MLKPFVDGLLSHSHSSLHGFGLSSVSKALWTLDECWSFPNIAIVSLSMFSCITKVAEKRVSKDGNIIPFATIEGAVNPNNLSR